MRHTWRVAVAEHEVLDWLIGCGTTSRRRVNGENLVFLFPPKTPKLYNMGNSYTYRPDYNRTASTIADQAKAITLWHLPYSLGYFAEVIYLILSTSSSLLNCRGGLDLFPKGLPYLHLAIRPCEVKKSLKVFKVKMLNPDVKFHVRQRCFLFLTKQSFIPWK